MSKLLGRFDVVSFYELNEESQAEAVCLYEGEAKEENYFFNDKESYQVGEFIRSDGRFDGVMGVSNSSAVGAVMSADCEQAVLQLIC